MFPSRTRQRKQHERAFRCAARQVRRSVADDGRNRNRRFETESEALAFDRAVSGATVSAPATTAGDPSMEARLAQLEARLAAAEGAGAQAAGGVYALSLIHI